jgi:DedD protein
VRLGSFGEKANAEGLVARLREQGYKGFNRPINSSRGPLTGVYVGPVLTEAEADSLQRQLASEFELEGVVVQFSIEELEQ